MAASPDTPWVSVSLISEAAFCPRAGRFQYEESQEDTGEEDALQAARGWYRKPYTLRDIKRQIAKAGGRLVVFLAGASGGAWLAYQGGVLRALTAALPSDSRPLWLGGLRLMAAVAAAVCLFAFLRAGATLLVLLWYRARAAAAVAREPDVNHAEPQPVDWWSLLQAGFQRTFLGEALRDEKWHLAGRPWCILVKGSLRIPVFRKRSEDPKLHRQYFARMAAYAHLIESAEGSSVPYGIVLLGQSYRGMTVPITVPTKKTFHDSLVEARRIIASGERQSGPSHDGKCRRCPWGRPTVVSFTRGRGASYSSICGERYGWVPPHEKAFRKGLR